MGELSAAERHLLAVALNYPLCGIHADALAEDADLAATTAEPLIAALAADGFLLDSPLVDIDGDGKRCWTVGRFSEIRDGGIKPLRLPTPETHTGPLPDWLHASFWNHPDPATLRLPEDGDYVAARLLGDPSSGVRQQGWALAHLHLDVLQRVKPFVNEQTIRRINYEIDHRD